MGMEAGGKRLAGNSRWGGDGESATKLLSESFFVPTTRDGWTQAGLGWSVLDPNMFLSVQAIGTFDSLFVIPDPTTAALTALGLVGQAMRRRIS